MSTLLLISGPSGVGKGPMINTLFRYASANNINITKHILYTDRDIRPGEEDGVTYHFVKTAALRKMEARNPGGFIIFELPTQIQGINIETLHRELKENSLVLLEIFYEQAPLITDICKENNIPLKKVFIKPLSDKDYEDAGCTDDTGRETVTRDAMQTKLVNRATDPPEKIPQRAASAFTEIKNHEGYDYDLVNHYGEDERALWALLYEFVSVRGGLEMALKHDKLKGIAETFKSFVEEVGIQTHS